MDNAQGDSPGQPVTCKDPGAELLHMCFWHMDSDFLLAVRVALTKIFHFPIAIRTETCTKTKKGIEKEILLISKRSFYTNLLIHLVAYVSEHILQSTPDNAQGDNPVQPVTCLKDYLPEAHETLQLNQTTSVLIKHFV